MVERTFTVAGQGPSNKIQIFISGRKLKDLDVFSKSDPICHVYIKDSKCINWSLVGKTENIMNDLNPDFTKHFTIDYYFEREQHLKFEMYDVDATELEHIGNVEFTVAKLMGSLKQTFIGDLTLPSDA